MTTEEREFQKWKESYNSYKQSMLSSSDSTTPSDDILSGVDNPYLQESPTYRNWYGGVDQNATNSAAFDLAIKRAEWDSNMQLYKFELWYNSEIEKVRRLRQVGINPDLVGLDSASTTDAPSMSPAGSIGAEGAQISAQNASNAAQVGKIIADTCLMAISQGFTIAQNVQTIKGLKLENLHRKLMNDFQSLENVAKQISIDSSRINRFSDIRKASAYRLFDMLTPEGVEQIGNPISALDQDFFGSYFRNPNDLERYNPEFADYESITGDNMLDAQIWREMNYLRNNPEVMRSYYQSYRDMQTTRQDIASIMSSPAYSDNMDEFIAALKPLMSAEFDRKLQEVDTVISQLEYQQEYYDGLSGTAAATAANETNWNTAGQQKAAAAYASAYRGMIVAAQEMMNAGNPLGALLLLVSNVVGEGLDVIKGTAGDALSTALGVSAAK